MGSTRNQISSDSLCITNCNCQMSALNITRTLLLHLISILLKLYWSKKCLLPLLKLEDIVQYLINKSFHIYNITNAMLYSNVFNTITWPVHYTLSKIVYYTLLSALTIFVLQMDSNMIIKLHNTWRFLNQTCTVTMPVFPFITTQGASTGIGKLTSSPT
jgi:hypothetical protein